MVFLGLTGSLLIVVLLSVMGIVISICPRDRKYFPIIKRGKYGLVYGGNQKGMKIISFRHVVMLDWDVPNEGHVMEGCVTIRRKEEAIVILQQYCMEDKKMLFRVYETPGGVRAFLVSRMSESVRLDEPLMRRLSCDPLYTRLCASRGEWACRVSPKVGRKGDYVARYWTTIGDGKEDEGAMELVKYHDELISGWSAE